VLTSTGLDHFNQSGSSHAHICKVIQRIMIAREEFTMREWLFVVAPLAVVGYFLVFPDQLQVFMDLFYGVFH
jgi:hypothetical protein